MILRDIPIVEQVLDAHRLELGSSFEGYRNHVYRVINFSGALANLDESAMQRLFIAAAFHDIGIWTDKTFDYLSPSASLASDFLRSTDRTNWEHQVALMIDQHHKLGSYANETNEVEVFRRADLIDLSLGLRRFGLSREYVKGVRNEFPNHGFHTGLLKVAGQWVCKHPLRPLPVVKF